MVALQVNDESSSDIIIESSFHLPGGHNQKNHGNRVGKPGNLPTKKSSGGVKTQPGTNPKSDPDAPTHTEGMSSDEYFKRLKKAKSGRKALLSVPHSSEWEMIGFKDKETNQLNGYDLGEIFKATRSYQSNAYRSINRELRGKKGNLTNVTPTEAEEIKRIDAALKTSPTDSEIYVTRGIVNPSKTFGSAWNKEGSNAGLTWREDGYTSSTVKASVSEAFGKQSSQENEPVILHILAPKGTRGIGLDFKVANAIGGEGEILLDRGLKFRIVRDSGPVTPGGAVVRNLYVEVVTD